MFKNPRYATSRVNAEILMYIQIKLWSMIESAGEEVSLDYLQVFKLTAYGNKQKIVHTQEVPPYKKSTCLV